MVVFFGGLMLILLCWIFIGFIIEVYGIVVFFGDFLGIIVGFVRGVLVIGLYIGVVVDRFGLGMCNSELFV